jgi:hypothetical protein
VAFARLLDKLDVVVAVKQFVERADLSLEEFSNLGNFLPLKRLTLRLTSPQSPPACFRSGISAGGG